MATIFFAKLLGLYFLFMGVFLLSKGPFIHKAILQLKGNSLATLFSGSLRLLFGLILVIAHPTWEMNWSTLITIIGYLLIISGIIRLFFPEFFFHLLGKAKMQTFTYAGIICLIIGLLLVYQGFIVAIG